MEDIMEHILRTPMEDIMEHILRTPMEDIMEDILRTPTEDIIVHPISGDGTNALSSLLGRREK
jgi:hypothetical protein